jgi:hypothetical protein
MSTKSYTLIPYRLRDHNIQSQTKKNPLPREGSKAKKPLRTWAEIFKTP